jgi:hypothetical protein
MVFLNYRRLRHLFVVRQLVEPRDHQIGFQELMAGAAISSVSLLTTFEGEMEAAGQLILPRVEKAPG